jgi:putative transposase
MECPMPSLKAYRRSPRLKDFDYSGPLAAHLVFVTRRREPIFSATELAGLAIAELAVISARFGATVHAYCFMPDHAHLLVEIPEAVSLREFVRIYKQTSGFAIP